MKVEWSCDGCRSIVRFSDDKPMKCFAQGVLAGLLLADHRKKCQGNHYENGNTSVPPFEVVLVGAVEGKSWRAIKKASLGRGD